MAILDSLQKDRDLMDLQEVLADRFIPAGDDYFDREELRALTPAELIRRTRALAPLVAAEAAQAERLRRPTEEVWAALRRSGYFYQFVPTTFGGMAIDLEGFIDATLPIAEADPSTAWIATFCAGHNHFVANFGERMQAELFGGRFPYVIAPALGFPPGKAVREESGIRVNGTWKWATGITHADWALAVVLVQDGDEQPTMALAAFPASDARVLDTWQADGMAATGSHDVEVNDLFVPDRRVLTDLGILSGRGLAARLYPEPVWRVPTLILAALLSAVPVLGGAKGVLRAFKEQLPRRKHRDCLVVQAERPAAQLRLAEADLTITTAELLIRDAARRAVTVAGLEEPAHTEQRIELRARISHAVSLCRKATQLLAEGAGASVHMQGQAFGRLVRDVAMGSSHAGFEVDVGLELHGRALLGLPPNVTMI